MPTPAGSDYHDRKTGLVVFGILEIAIGFICVLLMLLMLVGRAFASRNPDMPHAPSIMIPVAVYGSAAVAFVWLGVGSILTRRWARAILLCLSAVGLVMGIFVCGSMVFVLPHMFDVISQQARAPLQPAALLMVKVVMSVFLIIVYVVIPGALFLFYRSPHVKRTCEVRDPVERWTDRCPLPVLAFSLLMGMGGMMFLVLLTQFHVLPLFGYYVSGGAGLLLCVALGGLLLYLAYGFYSLHVRAWWIALGTQVLFTTSSIVTFYSGNLAEMYTKMGIDQRNAAMSAKLMDSPAFKWMTVLSLVPWLVWLLYVRRYFDKPQVPPVLPEGEAPVPV